MEIGGGKQMNRKEKSLAAAAAFCLAEFLACNPLGWNISPIFFNRTASMPVGFYLRIPNTGIRDGDIVVYEPTEEAKSLLVERHYTEKGDRLMKIVGAMPGESYGMDEKEGFLVRGKYIGPIFASDTLGRELPVRYGTFRVEPGHFLPVGEHALSFDGRYEGTVPQENIVARVVPLFTLHPLKTPLEGGCSS